MYYIILIFYTTQNNIVFLVPSYLLKIRMGCLIMIDIVDSWITISISLMNNIHFIWDWDKSNK